MSEIGKHFQDAERAEEISHGGLVKREGNLVTLGDGSRWWLNGEQWARDSADATIRFDLNSPVVQSIRAQQLRRGMLNG